MAEKAKGLSKKNKIIICAAVLLCAAVIVLICGLKAHSDYMKTGTDEVKTIQFLDFENKNEVKLIAHRGFRATAPENTIPAFERAGISGFWGAECDVFRTSDGVWVISHDKNTNRMMDAKLDIESTTYEELLKHNIDNGNGLINFTELKVATLDEYLEQCELYGMTAVIELKSENNTEHYEEIISAVAGRNVSAIYISFYEKDLKAIRELDKDSKLFYLTGKIDGKAIDVAKGIENCGVEFNAGEKKNLKNNGAAIKKITDAGLEAACWGGNEPELVQTLAEYGVLYITTDCVTY